VFRSAAFTVIFVSALESPWASATLAAPATRAPITAPKTVDLILPPEMKRIRKLIKFGATLKSANPPAVVGRPGKRRSIGVS
jgi:hypothetical protein